MKNFKEWLDLQEMPLQHLGHDFVSDDEDPSVDHGDINTLIDREKFGKEGLDKNKLQVYKNSDGSRQARAGLHKFTKRDKSLISSPKTFNVLKEKLKNIGFNFNILFIEDRLVQDDYLKKVQGKYNPRGERLLNNEEYADLINKYLLEKGINKNNSITFAQPASSGHMLTPWMILHRIGHALFDSASAGSKDVSSKIKNIMFTYFGLEKETRQYASPDFLKSLENVFMFKSVHNTGNYLETPFESILQELVHELVAEYLWHGKIRINPQILSNGSWWSGDQRSRNYIKGIKKIEQNIVGLLKMNVGKIIEPSR